MTHFALITVVIETESGETGLGYTYTVGDIGGAAVHSLIYHDLTPVLENSSPDEIATLWDRMWWRLHFVGRGGLAAFAMAAVDTALWDLKAKRQNRPLWQTLGGTSNRVSAYAGGIDLQFTTEALLDQAQGFLDQGFRAIKMKVGRDELSEDVSRIVAMREKLGADFPLLADANMRWSVDEAITAARAFAPHNLVWLEEPTIPDDIEGHARVAKEGGVPIASGENLHSTYEFEHLIQRGGVSYPEPDAATLGGVTPWMKVAAMAAERQLPVTSHGVHDIHVHLLAAVPNASFLEVHGFGLERFIHEPLQLDQGEAIAPNRPGHGIEFDWEALEEHRVRDGIKCD